MTWLYETLFWTNAKFTVLVVHSRCELTFPPLLPDVRLNYSEKRNHVKICSCSIHSWVCGPPAVPENNGEIWVCMLLAPIMQCLSPGENQPSFLILQNYFSVKPVPRTCLPCQDQWQGGEGIAQGRKKSSSQSLSGSAEVTVELPRAVSSISLLYFSYKCYPQCFLVRSWLPPLYPGVLGSSCDCVRIVLTSPPWQKQKQSPWLDMEFRVQ